MLITSTQAKAIRRKQADKKLTAKQAGEEIGVTQVTSFSGGALPLGIDNKKSHLLNVWRLKQATGSRI